MARITATQKAPPVNQPTEPIKVDFDLLHPCGDCPFTKNGKSAHAGVILSLPTYIDLIEQQTLSHTCHKTDNRPSCDGPRNFKGDRPKHCAGLLHMWAKSAIPLQKGIMSQNIDFEKLFELALSQNSPAFDSIGALVKHYAAAAWGLILIYFEDPLVIPDTPGSDQKIRLSQITPGTPLIPCHKCGQPASRLDPLHPYHSGKELCDICYHGSQKLEAIIQLIQDHYPRIMKLAPTLQEIRQ